MINLRTTVFKAPGFILMMALSLLLSLPAISHADEAINFISVLEDLPLMTGLSEDEDAAMVFTTADGRVIEAVAKGNLLKEEITSFYGQTLPQLGWDQINDVAFTRDNEILKLEISGGNSINDPALVLFSITPSAPN